LIPTTRNIATIHLVSDIHTINSFFNVDVIPKKRWAKSGHVSKHKWVHTLDNTPVFIYLQGIYEKSLNL